MLVEGCFEGSAFLRDPSTCLMEAPEVWDERERSKME